MSDVLFARPAGGMAAGAADWLRLAAAPTFATLALLTGLSGGEAMCSVAHEVSPLNGMAAMYGLMSVFHAPPWLKLASGLTRSAL